MSPPDGRLPRNPITAVIVFAVLGLGSLYVAVQSFLAGELPDALVELLLVIVFLYITAYAWRRLPGRRSSDDASQGS